MLLILLSCQDYKSDWTPAFFHLGKYMYASISIYYDYCQVGTIVLAKKSFILQSFTLASDSLMISGDISGQESIDNTYYFKHCIWCQNSRST